MFALALISVPLAVAQAADTIPPTVSIKSPSNGATVTGSITFSATATDNTAVNMVYFVIDGMIYNTVLYPPYFTVLNTGGYSNGAHKFMVIAYDNAWNEARQEITVYINNVDTTPPTVTITNPASGATVSGTINIDVRSYDANVVKKIEYYADGALIGTVTTLTHPDAFYYASIAWNTASLPNGSHTIVAKGFDSYNNVGTRSITVTVSNVAIKDTTPPVVSISSPGNGATLKGVTTVSVSASDSNSGMYMVLLYVDNKYVGAGWSSPYNFSLDTRAYANGAHTIMVIAFDKANNYSIAAVSVNVAN